MEEEEEEEQGQQMVPGVPPDGLVDGSGVRGVVLIVDCGERRRRWWW